MMIKGIGTDIIEIERIAAVYKRRGQRFLDFILTPSEQAYCLEKVHPEASIAVRFAAKEAVAKALGVGFGHHLRFLDIEVVNGPLGTPTILLSDRARAHFNNPHLLISLSHSRCYATAVALWQEKE